MRDVLLDIIDVLLAFVYLAVNDHQIVKTLLHIRPIGFEELFLFLDFLLDGSTLILKAFDLGIRIDRGFLGGRCGFAGFGFGFTCFGSCLRFGCRFWLCDRPWFCGRALSGGRFFGHSLLLLCSRRNQHHQRQYDR